VGARGKDGTGKRENGRVRTRESRSLDRYRRNQGRPPTPLPAYTVITESRHPLGLFFFASERVPSNLENSFVNSRTDPPVRLATAYPFRPMGVSVHRNPDAEERTSEQCAAALAAFFAHREIARILLVVCRVLACTPRVLAFSRVNGWMRLGHHNRRPACVYY